MFDISKRDEARRSARESRIRNKVSEKSIVKRNFSSQYMIPKGASKLGNGRACAIIGDGRFDVRLNSGSGGLSSKSNKLTFGKSGEVQFDDAPHSLSMGDYMINPVIEMPGFSSAASPRPIFIKKMHELMGLFKDGKLSEMKDLLNKLNKAK